MNEELTKAVGEVIEMISKLYGDKVEVSGVDEERNTIFKTGNPCLYISEFEMGNFSELSKAAVIAELKMIGKDYHQKLIGTFYEKCTVDTRDLPFISIPYVIDELNVVDWTKSESDKALFCAGEYLKLLRVEKPEVYKELIAC